MAAKTKKRTLNAFFAPSVKRAKGEEDAASRDGLPSFSEHLSYPLRIRNFPPPIASVLPSLPCSLPKEINDRPHLDLLAFHPYFPKDVAKQVFEFLRRELPFYRVEYTIKMGGVETLIKTPRYTTVFGLDSTSYFSSDGAQILDNKTHAPVLKDKNYTANAPRPLPACLDLLRHSIEAATSTTYNFCLVNYYASGSDSISYHSDDESFLGSDPTIASFSLGAPRDFLMKHKPVPQSDNASAGEQRLARDLEGRKPLKLLLTSGDCVVMRGTTQQN